MSWHSNGSLIKQTMNEHKVLATTIVILKMDVAAKKLHVVQSGYSTHINPATQKISTISNV